MEFVQILAIEDLEEGYFGIREPVITDESVTFSGMDKDPEKALIVMPGVAFDRERNRIGYKGGFYDRFLADNPEIKAIALGFECQISDETLPTEGHDIRPLKLITEAGIY